MASTWKVPARSGQGGNGEQRDIPEAGNHAAVCVAVIDLGHQLRRKFQSSEEEYQPLLYLCWELVGLDGRPLVGRDFKVSLHEKAGLRHFVEQWCGKLVDGADFDLCSLAGRPCLLNVLHDVKGDRTFARIEGASPLPKIGKKVVEVEAPEHDPIVALIDERKKLPDWLPWLYGRSLPEWLADSRERKGQPRQQDREPGDEEEEEVPAGGSIPF